MLVPMLFDPRGFTGPPSPTSNDHRSNGNDDRSESTTSFTLESQLYDRLVQRNCFPSSDGSERESRGRSSDDHDTVDHRPFESYRNVPDIGNHATAFNFSFDSVTPFLGSRRSYGRRSNGPTEDSNNNNDPFSSTSRQRSKSESFFSTGNKTTRPNKDRGHTVLEESVVDRPCVSVADAVNVPSDDVFVYTAYNDANNDVGSDPVVAVSHRGIRGKVFEGTKLRGTKTTRREVVRRDDTIRGEKTVRYDREDNSFSEFRVKNERRSESDYTARFQEPIITVGKRPEDDDQLAATTGPSRLYSSRGRNYGFLFILYLLAWPLACTGSPSGQFASRFAENPSVDLQRHNITQHSSTSSSSSSSSSNVAYQSRQQQHLERERYVQEAGSKETGHRRHMRREQQREPEVSLYQGQQADQQADHQQQIVPETVHPYNEYSWEVNQINPWLSACDLAGPAPADLQGSCGPPEVPKNCLAACAVATTTTTSRGNNGIDAEFHEVIGMIGRSNKDGSEGVSTKDRSEGVPMAPPEQCLFYLEESHKKDVCRDDFGRSSTRSFLTPRENRYRFVSGLRLRHCCEHAVVNALAPGTAGPLENVLNGGQKCVDALDKLLLVDALAARLHCEFEEVLARYDCAQPYSVIFNCTHCKEAYRKWVCSSLVPYFAHGEPQESDTSETSWTGSRLRPCRSFCQSVEQRCPYLLPGDRAPAYPTQYAGEPTFLCRDPNIAETGEQAARALHGSEGDECCFRVCSEERPGSGICANCTDWEPRKRGRSHDLPTAPHCEINPIQPAFAGAEYLQPDSTESSIDGEEDEDSSRSPVSSSSANVMQQQQQQQQQQGTSLCGSGGIGSIPSVSSSDRPSASSFPRAIWFCSILASFLGNVQTIPAIWIPRIFLRLVTVLTGDDDNGCADRGGSSGGSSGGSGGDADGTKPEKTGQLDDLVGWLHRCCSASRISYVGVRHGAKWMLEKWVMVERRCRGCWWCCWWWWWWRWRRLSAGNRVRWKYQSRPTAGKCCCSCSCFCSRRFDVTCRSTGHGPASIRSEKDTILSKILRDRYHGCCCESMQCRYWPYHYSSSTFTAKCRLWWWWWWRWLYRYWMSRWKNRRCRSNGNNVSGNVRPVHVTRRRPRWTRHRTSNRSRRRKQNGDGPLSIVGDGFGYRSPATQRHHALPTRKDPP